VVCWTRLVVVVGVTVRLAVPGLNNTSGTAALVGDVVVLAVAALAMPPSALTDGVTTMVAVALFAMAAGIAEEVTTGVRFAVSDLLAIPVAAT
jgi:hypothetical protein